MAENKSENIDDFDKMLSDILEGESLKSDNEQMSEEKSFDRNKKYWVEADSEPKKTNKSSTTIKNKTTKPANKKVGTKKISTTKAKQANGKSEPQKPKVKVGTVIKTMLFTIFCFLCSFCFVVICLTPIAPNVVLRAFDYVGAKNATYLVYKRVYERHKTNENLYNVIQLAIERKEYEDMEQYIEIMVQGDKFSNFANKVDEKNKLALGEMYSIYANSYESYLRGNWVLALYKNDNKLSAKMLAIDSVEGTVTELYVYVKCIEGDENLTNIQKETELKTLQTRYNMVDMLKIKLDSLQDEYSMATTSSGKLVAINQKILILDIIITIGANSLKEDELTDFKSERIALNTEASNILKQLKEV